MADNKVKISRKELPIGVRPERSLLGSISNLSSVPTMVAAVSTLLLLSVMGSFAEWSVTLLIFLLFSFAFLPITIRFFRWSPLCPRDSFVFGMASSFAVSCMFTSAFIYFFGWQVGLLPIALGMIGIITFLLQGMTSFQKISVGEQTGDDDKSPYEYILLVLVLCSIAIPLLGIGKLTPRGMAYSSLMGYDFLNRVSYTIAVTRSIPTENPFFAGRPFPYHILAFVLPAFAYKILGAAANIQHILRIFFLLLAILLVSCFFGCLRAYGFSFKTRMYAGILAFFAYSYNGLAVAFRDLILLHGGEIGEILQKRGLLDFSSASHGIFRTLIIEPHSVLALCIALTLFALIRSTDHQNRVIPGIIFSATLLAAALGIEIFLGAALTLWFGCMMLYLGLREKEIRKQIMVGLSVLIPIFLLTVVLYSKMGIVDFSENRSSLVIGPSKTILLTAPALIPIELGPSIFFAAYVFIKKRFLLKKARHDLFAIACMLAIGFFGFLFVHHPTEKVLVLRKSVMILQIPLWLMFGLLCEDNLPRLRFHRPSSVVAIILLILSLQTFIWDVRTFSAWNNPKLTAYISSADYEACRWIIEHTAPDSVIQSWISYGSDVNDSEASSYSIIPEFAERPAAIGIWEIAWYSRTETDTPATRWKDIRDILFRGTDAREAWKTARKYNIDYIYVGPYEKKEAPEGCGKFGDASDIFETQYDRSGVTIYKVL